jgi:hypothetical protein
VQSVVVHLVLFSHADEPVDQDSPHLPGQVYLLGHVMGLDCEHFLLQTVQVVPNLLFILFVYIANSRREIGSLEDRF